MDSSTAPLDVIKLMLSLDVIIGFHIGVLEKIGSIPLELVHQTKDIGA